MSDTGQSGRQADQLFANPIRARIYDVLSREEASASEIARMIGLPVPNVSYHVRTLAAAGLIEPSRTTRHRGAVETHFRIPKGLRRRQGDRRLTPSRRRALISPLMEAVFDGIDSTPVDPETHPHSVFFIQATEWEHDTLNTARDLLTQWSARLLELEAQSWVERRDLRWYAAPAWLCLGDPPPGSTRMSVMHARADEFELQPAIALPHERAIPPTDEPFPERMVSFVDDPGFAVLEQPLRYRIFRLLLQPASAKELAQALGETVPNVSYHVRILRDSGFLTVVDERKRRGAVETYYRARFANDVSDEEWNQLTAQQRKQFVPLGPQEAMHSVRAMTLSGGFDDPAASLLSRRLVRLDDTSAAQAAAELMELNVTLAALPAVSGDESTGSHLVFGAAFFATEPMPGTPLELRRDGSPVKRDRRNVVIDADPCSDANRIPALASAAI